MKRRNSSEIKELITKIKNDINNGLSLSAALKKNDLSAPTYYRYSKPKKTQSKPVNLFNDNEIISVVRSNLDRSVKQRILATMI